MHCNVLSIKLFPKGDECDDFLSQKICMLEDGVLPSVDTGHEPYLFNKDDINRSAMSTFRFKDM